MDKKARVTGLVLTAIVALAAWFRFFDIQNYPPGLFPDEAANGEDALLILNGDVRPFYPRGNGREAMFFYLQAISIKLFGIGAWQMHAASALIGTVTVAALFFATRPWFGRLAGLLAAFFLATNHWHLTMSRTGFRAIMIPLFVALFTAFVGYLITSVKKARPANSARPEPWRPYLYAGLAGAAFAGGFYTYIAYRIMIGVVLGMAVLILLDDWILELRRHHTIHGRDLPHVMRYWPQILIGLAAAALVLAPLGLYFIQHPDEFLGRAGQVSIFNPALQREYGGGTLEGTLAYSLRATLLSFFAGEGDLNWRHNVPGTPLLNPLVGVLFLLGLAWTIHGTVLVIDAIVRGREVHLGMIYPYLLLLLGGMLLPIITTAEGMPHGLRSVGLVVPIFLLSGTAASVMLYWFRRRVRSDWERVVITGVTGGLLMLSAIHTGSLYFLIARNDPAAHYAYRGDLSVVAEFLKAYAAANPAIDNDRRPYLALDEFSLQSVHFLTAVAAHDQVTGLKAQPDETRHLWRQLDPAASHLTNLMPGEIIIFTQSTLSDANRYVRQQSYVKIKEQRFNRFGQEIMRVYEAPIEGSDDEAPAALDA